MLGEVLGNMVLRCSGAVGDGGMGPVVELVGASHCERGASVSVCRMESVLEMGEAHCWISFDGEMEKWSS